MKEITAKQNMYLTQVEVSDEQNRMFLTKLIGASVNISLWRDATQTEKEEWENEQASITDQQI